MNGEEKSSSADVKSANTKSNHKKSKRKADVNQKPQKKWKGKRWRRWDIKVTFNLHKYEPPTEEEIIKVCVWFIFKTIYMYLMPSIEVEHI